MSDVHLDFETYSAVPIAKAGSYRYARDASTEVLIASYWLPGMDPELDMPHVWLPHKTPPPRALVRAAADPETLFWAHNAQFERGIWHHVLHQRKGLPEIIPERWRCTAAMAASNGLGRKLETALRQLGTGVAKDTEGSRLIKVFCIPRKPTKANAKTRILPDDAPEDFKKFILYCQRDVIGERELHEQLIPMLPREQAFFTLDMHMNERGLPIDLPTVRKARAVLAELEADIAERVQAITGGIKATQGAKLKEWFATRGLDLDNLQAQTIRDVLAMAEDLPEDMRGLLALRIEAGKASTKKLISMEACSDPVEHIIQGSFLFHGAHTGRYAGRLVQPQNFIRGKLKEWEQHLVFRILQHKDAIRIFKMLYDWPIDIISQCMRGFIKAPDGYRFVVVDYSAIEARVLAWVCGENKVLRAYREGVDVYKMMAASLFGVRIEDVDSEQRRLAKNLVLGCGYALGGARFVDYCAGMGQEVEPAFAAKAVKKYRADHPNIVRSWTDVEDAAVEAIRNPGTVTKAVRCKFRMRKHWLCIQLPSGRELRYPRAKAVPVERWGKAAHQISYETDYHGKIVRETTYGGKLIENIVQGIARDVMREGTFAAEEAGYPVHGTVHDELITMRKLGQGSHKELEAVVCDLPDWTNGIPLGAEGFECSRYRKG